MKNVGFWSGWMEDEWRKRDNFMSNHVHKTLTEEIGNFGSVLAVHLSVLTNV